MTRALGALAAATLAVVLPTVVPASPAAAATYYEYWSYWHKAPNATTWHYSSVGPSGYHLQEGTQVEGWRYAVGTAAPTDPKPRPVDVTYDTYCHGHDAAKTYRVLLVVDYGTASRAPSGPVYSCYGFDDQPSGFSVLTQQHAERDSGGLICAIDGYPRTGCGDTVSSPAPRPTPRKSTTTAAKPTATAAGPAGGRTPSPSGATTPPRAGPSTSATSATSAASRTSPSSPAPTGTPAASATPTTVTARPFEAPADGGGIGWLGPVLGALAAGGLGAGALWLRR